MYLSRLVIDRRNRRAAGDLEDIYDMHRTVMSVFPHVDAPHGARSSMSALYRVRIGPACAVCLHHHSVRRQARLEQTAGGICPSGGCAQP